MGLDESAPVVDGDPASTEAADYAADKRGGELAVQQEFDGPVVLARAGLILGPYENVGRMPFWLRRIAAGGRVPAPGPHDRPLQYIDARDLARLGARPPAGRHVQHRQPRAVTPRSGELLDECVRVTGVRRRAGLADSRGGRGVPGVAPWTELPIWMPPDGASSPPCTTATSRRRTTPGCAAGRSPRPSRDTWAWLQREGTPDPATTRAGTGLDAEAEQRLWDAAGG